MAKQDPNEEVFCFMRNRNADLTFTNTLLIWRISRTAEIEPLQQTETSRWDKRCETRVRAHSVWIEVSGEVDASERWTNCFSVETSWNKINDPLIFHMHLKQLGVCYKKEGNFTFCTPESTNGYRMSKNLFVVTLWK